MPSSRPMRYALRSQAMSPSHDGIAPDRGRLLRRLGARAINARNRRTTMSRATNPSSADAGANLSIALCACSTSPSAPRSRSVSTRIAVVDTKYPRWPRSFRSAMALLISDMAPSRSPRRACSRAMYTSTTGASLRKNRFCTHMSRNCPRHSRPRSRSVASRCTNATPSAHRILASAKSSPDSSAICTASSISRTAASSATSTPNGIAGVYFTLRTTVCDIASVLRAIAIARSKSSRHP